MKQYSPYTYAYACKCFSSRRIYLVSQLHDLSWRGLARSSKSLHLTPDVTLHDLQALAQKQAEAEQLKMEQLFTQFADHSIRKEVGGTPCISSASGWKRTMTINNLQYEFQALLQKQVSFAKSFYFAKAEDDGMGSLHSRSSAQTRWGT